MKKFLMLLGFICMSWSVLAQSRSGLISGPWAGSVELRSAAIWLEAGQEVRTIAVQYAPVNSSAKPQTVVYRGEAQRDYNPVKITLTGLTPNTTYNYTVLLNGKAVNPGFPTQFTTKELWQWRKPAPDFTFLTGSCAYFNEAEYDRPGKPYGGDSSIFQTMAKENAAFHLWLGDNWYTREVDFADPSGLRYRARRDRSLPILQAFMAKMPQYAIWDDHDFGPNDASASYIFKPESRQVFQDYWLNPSYGEEGRGVYTQFSYSDVDFFLLDDRYFRSSDNLPDSVNGQPNLNKIMFGTQQMNWLENALANSKATFKIIACGTQVLNPVSPFDCVRHFPADYEYLLQMLEVNRISGVVFLTGDRHHSEIIKVDRRGAYPLHDITVSPYTSGTHTFSGVEKNNPFRVIGVDEKQNYGRISVTGKRNERVLKIEFIGLKGDVLGEYVIPEQSIRLPRR